MLETTKQRDIQIVIFPEDGACIAQCLEIDVAAQGSTPSAALDSLCRGLARQIAISKILPDGELAMPSAAPPRYWDIFRDAEIEVPAKQYVSGYVEDAGRSVMLRYAATVRLTARAT